MEEKETMRKKMKMKVKERKPISIQTKWSLVFLAISIVPLLGATIFFMQYFGGVTKSDSEEKAKGILEMNTSRLSEWLQSKTSSVQELIARHPEFDTSKPESIFPVIKVLEESDNQAEGYSVISKEGMLTNMMGMTADSSTADYFLETKETLAPVVADMSFLEALNKHIITVIVPMVDAQSQFAGGIAFSVTPEIMTEMGKDIQVGETGYGYVISDAGAYYAYPDPERIGKNIMEYAKEPGLQEAVQTIMDGESGSETYKGEAGKEIITYYKSVPGTNWKLLINVPKSEVYAKVTSAQTLAAIIVVIVILLVVMLSLFLTRRMVKPVTAISAVMRKVADGRLGERVIVSSRDEIGQMGQSINHMIESMAGMVKMIDSTVVEVAVSAEGLLNYANQSSDTSEQIAVVIQEVAQGMEEQFRGSEQSARATEEMAIGLQRIAESSVSVSDQAETVRSEVESGYSEIQSTLDQMVVISSTAGRTAEFIGTLTQQSQEIGQIVDVISEISSQTSLLSLNASIEAARAGEHGRGFGVVANEVKKLAERTSTAIVDIVELIRQIQASTINAASSMESSITEIYDGMDKMKNVGIAFDHIRSSIREVSVQIQDVSAINEEMSAGTEEITASVSGMLTIAQTSAENAQAVAEASSDQTELMQKVVTSAVSLNLMMSELKGEIERFR